MKVGFTFDLRDDYLKLGYSEEETAEFDRPSTIKAISSALKANGYKVELIGNIRSLVSALAAGKRWDIVFNICEGMHGISRESQVPALLEAYNIPVVFSDAVTIALCHHKGLTKRFAQSIGVKTPNFFEIYSTADIVANKNKLKYPIFIKPLAEGTGKGITAASKITNQNDFSKLAVDLLKKYPSGLLVEEFLVGKEYTVSILGTGAAAEIIGTLEIRLRANAEAEVYSFKNKEYCEELVDYVYVNNKFSKKCETIALKLWRAIGCRDAGRIDFKLDANGVPNLLEINPLAGLHPEHSDLPMTCTAVGMKYNTLIKKIMASAIKRIDKTKNDQKIK